MMKRMLIDAMMRSVIVAVLCSLSWSAYAIADDTAKHPINIPPQNLASALQQLSKQSETDLVFRPEQVKGYRTQGLVGTFSAEQAVIKLIEGSALKVSVDATGALLIAAPLPRAARPLDSTGASQQLPSSSPATGNSLHLGQATVAQASAATSLATESDGGAEYPADAAPGDDQAAGGPTLEEIIVTAQKYRQRAIDVPIAMTVIGGMELKKLQITDLDDLQFYVPGLDVDNQGEDLRITIRGISNGTGRGALVGTYLDEADLTSDGYFGLDPNTYDLARVEVLKGPQGTLYGDGSMGGTIRYITNKPVLDEVQMGADVTGLFDQYGAPEARVEAVLNAPLVKHVFGLRIATELDDGGGWIDQPAANRKNINSKNLADVRIEGRWEPRRDVTVDGTEVIHRSTAGPMVGENPVGEFTQVFNLTNTPSIEDNYDISNVTLNWSPGVIAVVNSATYFTHNLNVLNASLTFPLLAPPFPPFDDYSPSAATVDESLSDELRLSSSSAGPWRWTLGGFYKRFDDNVPLDQGYFGLTGAPGTSLPAPSSFFRDVYSKSRAVFGDTNYRIVGRLVVGAGVRYFKDNENSLATGNAAREQATFTSVDPRFYARYGISRNVNIYASAAKGFRSGGFNAYGEPPYQPEHVWSYELGTKMRVLDGRLSFNSDVFFSDYADYQITGIVPFTASPIANQYNAGTAHIKGVEAEATWIPTTWWRLGINGDYINARFVQINVLDSAYAVGDPLDYAPRYQVTASVERGFRWNGRSGFAGIDYTQRARATNRSRNFGPWFYSQSDYMYLASFHTGINWTDNLELGFFVENLLNDRGYTGAVSLESYAAREQPRTFGVQFRANLE
jgi:iron complex outermembrane recepter protein